MALYIFGRNYLVAMPTAVELSTWIAVGSCFHPISDRVVRIVTDVWALTNMVPYLASVDDVMMLRIFLYTSGKIQLTVGTKSSEVHGKPEQNIMDCRGQVDLC